MKNHLLKIMLLIPSMLLWHGASGQYCTGGPTATIDSNIESVSIVGENGSSVSYTGCPGVLGVEDLTATQSVDLIPGNLYTLDVQFGTCGGNYSGAGEVWIDFNQNQTFEASESIGSSTGTPGTAPWDAVVSFNFTVPLTALGGNTRMRVMQQEGGVLPLNPCGSYNWGSVVDFEVSLPLAQYCSGGPSSLNDSNIETVDITGENASSIAYVGCPGVSGVEDQTAETVDLSIGSVYTLDVQFGSCGGNYAGAGEAWIDFNQNQVFDASESIGQSSGTPGTAPWDGIVSFTFTVPASAVAGPTNMRVMQQEGGVSPLDPCGSYTWGSVVDFTANVGAPVAVPYCSGGPSSLNDSNIETVDITGENASSIAYVGCPGVAGVEDQTAEIVDLTIGSVYTLDVQFGSCGGNYAGAGEAWIDFNQNQVFDASESIGQSSGTPGTAPWDGIVSFTFTVPASAVAGPTNIRVAQQEGGTSPLDPCASYTWGSVVDFTANVGAPVAVPYCSGGPSSLADSNIESVNITGENASSIAYVGCPGVAGVEDQSAETVDLIAGSIYTLDVQFGTCGGNYGGAGEAWIDFNQNQVFDANESIGQSSGTPGTAPWDGIVSFTFTVPLTSTAGNTNIRVMQQEGGSNPLNPCGTFTWGSVVDFTASITVPTSSCPFPTNLASSSINGSGATIDWTEAGTATTWNIEWGTPGFTPGTGNEVGSDVGNTSQTSIITGLNPITSYEVYVQADCGGGNESFWAGPLSFTTPCATYIAPFYEGFSSGALPTCWQNVSSGTGLNALWKFSNAPAYGALANGRTPGTYAWNDGSTPEVVNVELVTPLIDISTLTAPELTFDWFSNNTDYPGDNVPLIIEVFDGVSWNHLDTLSGDNPLWQNAFYDLSVYAGTSIQVRFRSNQQFPLNPGFYNDILLDEVSIDNAITCFPVTNLAATNITTTTADLSWTENNSATSWNIEFGPAGYTQGTPAGTVVPAVGTNPYTINISPSTDYEFYIQSICGPGDESSWEGPFAFTSLCASVTAPWSEDFAGGVIPVCWDQGAANGESWLFNTTAPLAGHIGLNGVLNGATTSGGGFAWVDDSSPHNVGTSLLSPMIDVSALTVPMLSFFLISDNEGFTNVTFSVDVWDGANWNVAVYSSNSNTVGGWEEIDVLLNALTITGDIQLRFVVDELNGTDFYDDIAIDDVRVYESPLPACSMPSALTASNITATSADLAWTENGTATSWNIEYGAAGFTLGNGIPELGVTNPYTLMPLAVNTTYEYYVQSDCGGTQSAWSGPFSFTTPCVASTGTDVQAACGTFTWIDGMVYTSSNNTATFNLVGGAANGCDSIVTLDLTINNAVTGTDVQTACETFTWIDGMVYTASNNTAMFTLVGAAANGCDSIVTLDLTINTPSTGTDVQVACETFTWIDGNVYTSSNNTATFNLVGSAANGCDSIVTLDLTIDMPADAGSDAMTTVCMNQPVDLSSLLGATADAGGAWFNPSNAPLSSSDIVASGQAGTYDYSYVVQVGSCPADTAVISIVVDGGCDHLSIEKELMVDISVYPNPASSVLTILNPSSVISLKMEMLDMNGRIVLIENSALTNSKKATLAIDRLETGVYTLRVYNNEVQKTFKIVKR